MVFRSSRGAWLWLALVCALPACSKEEAWVKPEVKLPEPNPHPGVAVTAEELARLRADGLVTARRDGKAIHYSIRDPKAAAIVKVVHDLFCATTC